MPQHQITVEDALKQLSQRADGKRFVDFTGDLVVWVILYGSEGGPGSG